ncbi:MAG TPA: carboxypeptidase regulatory-like domain-containing protein [Verrucomicrobiae bacterium]|nr:carboxypeptidase regulatory-like domain-containing protein [Verrucomicrobiae bacterium]
MNTAKSLGQVVVLLLLSIASANLCAQTSNGTLVGSVTDPTGAVLPKALVSAVSPQYGLPHETRTDSAGTYRMESLQPGIYTVTISAKSFETLTVTGAVIDGSLTTTINGKLKLAVSEQKIEVQATAAMAIDTQSGQLGQSIGLQELGQAPYEAFLGALNPTGLVMTVPGVQDTPIGKGAIPLDASVEGIGFSVNGSRPQANNFLIDGQDDNDYALTGQAFQPVNYGAIQEVTILTNAYAAEYGRGGGSVTNYIFKSGTNNYHGDVWEVNRNSAFAAIPAQDAVVNPITKNPQDNDNTFGFDVGGPVVKDKLFVFGAAQWRRERLQAFGPNGQFLPTPAGIATLQGLASSSPNISLFLAAIGPLVGTPTSPTPTFVPLGSGRPDVEIGRFQLQNIHTVLNNYDWNYRMDWQFTDHDVLTGSAIRDRLSLSPDIFGNFGALPSFETAQDIPAEIFRGQWAHTFSSALVNELRLSYTNLNLNFYLTGATAAGPLANIPYISFGNDINFPSIGVTTGMPQGRSHTAWQVQEALSFSANRHTIKAGADITVLNLQDRLGLNTRGSIIYNSGGGFSSLGNFADDWTGSDPGTYAKVYGNPNVNSSATMFAPYVEDTWRIRSDLTLTLGLRYEYWGALANALAFPAFNTAAGVGLPNAMDPSYSTDPAKFGSLFSFRQNPDKRNFAPRAGVAYAPRWGNHWFADGQTVVRAGYGIFYDGLFTEISDSSAQSQPNVLGGTGGFLPGRGTGNASTFPNIGPTTFNTRLLIQTMASNLHNPLTQQWNVNVQRGLPLGLVMTLAYVGTRGEHLFANQEFNPAVFFAHVNSNFGEVEVRTNGGDSWYSSGQVELERRIHTLLLRAAYTYSKFMDDTSGIQVTTGGATFSQILSNQHSDWGPSAYDRRHRFSILYDWPAPYFHRNAFLRALTDQWRWSGIATIETGTPNTVEVGFDNNGNLHGNSRPDLGNPAAPLNTFGINGADYSVPGFTPGKYYDYLCWYNDVFGGAGTTCTPKPVSSYHFVLPIETSGNVGRNSLFGPGQIYFDTAIQRDFPVHFWKRENQTFSFRADLFNALNHPNLFTPSYTMNDINFNNTAITIQGGREIKLWLKYSF